PTTSPSRTTTSTPPPPSPSSCCWSGSSPQVCSSHDRGSSMTTDTRRRPASTSLVHKPATVRTGHSRRGLPNPLPALILALFLVFFVLPVLWLALAATKTDDQLVHGHPLSFGSWRALRANWDALTAFQDDAILLWLRNSALYSGLALVITLCVAIPAG